jgi:tRNA (mo5U34)-methyltransferase
MRAGAATGWSRRARGARTSFASGARDFGHGQGDEVSVDGIATEHSSHLEWLRAAVAAEPYWFHKMDLGHGIVTAGWSEPAVDKLPHFGLPEDMSGARVLDIGCAEGFFSFEAERRGAAEVVAIDSFPDSVRRFNLARDVIGARAQAYLTNVYDLSPKTFGTFDIVMYFGVSYHLRHPLLALEKIFSVCSGTVLMQTASFENEALGDASASLFHPFGIESGPPEARVLDPTVFWVPNAACVAAMLAHVGFVNVEGGETPTVASVFRAEVPERAPGVAPDQMKAPWS